jgi:hypothetical protein
LPIIVEPTDWTSVVTFPAVYTKKVTVRIDTVYPPALPDTYATNGDGQVAISGIQFLNQWSLDQMFGFNYRQESTTVPTPTPSPSGSSSPSGSKSGSPSPSGSPSSSGKSGSPSPSGSKS